MSKKPKSEFELLQDEWYKKIAETPDKDGNKFVDIEKNETQLNTYTYTIYMDDYHNEITRKAKTDYYLMAYRFLESYKFNSDLELPGASDLTVRFLKKYKHNPKIDQIIWEYHSNGLSVREIAYTLNKSRATITNRTYVGYILLALRYKMFTTRLEEMEESNEQ